MKKHAFHIAFALGALAILWVAAAVAGSHPLVLVMTVVIGAVYTVGALELRQYRALTAQLIQSMGKVPPDLQALGDWLAFVPASLQNAVRQRVEGERTALPGPALTPYLVGLLVMLGMLGTFLGMVVTLNGAVFALEGTNNIQGMRAAFSEPIKGLGLAFGTSVAGVATSAMLGLMSSLARRERALSAQMLDTQIATGLRTFSFAYQRHETFKALQQQSQALPQVVSQLQALMAQIERHSQHTSDRLLANQSSFHQEVQTTYTTLAQSVDQSLRSSLSQSMQLASDGILPVVQATMAHLTEQTQALHERLQHTTQQQLQALDTRLSATAQAVAQTYDASLAQHDAASTRMVAHVGQALDGFSQTLEQRAQQWMHTVHEAQTQLQTQQASQDQQRLAVWTASLQGMADTLSQQWQQSGAQTLAQQQQMGEVLTRTAHSLHEQSKAHTEQSLTEVSRLLASAEELMRQRIGAETQWLAQHQARTEQLSAQVSAELAALREQEAQRGQAAVDRLSELQTAVTAHLSTLGTALEAPIAHLIETASEAPKAAAEVIGQLRQEISVSVARDNALLEERTRIMETLSSLLDAIRHASTEQRGVIDALVASSQDTLTQASHTFQAQVAAEAGKLGEITAQVTASAVDVASLGETFGFAVRSFSETSEKLMTSLHRIEAAMAQSMTRSDEQLAYYVAQAREIIELSISSQKDVLEALQQRQTEGTT